MIIGEEIVNNRPNCDTILFLCIPDPYVFLTCLALCLMQHMLYLLLVFITLPDTLSYPVACVEVITRFPRASGGTIGAAMRSCAIFVRGRPMLLRIWASVRTSLSHATLLIFFFFFLITGRPPRSPLFPTPTLFR